MWATGALLIESTPLKAGWLTPKISPQGITSLLPMEYMTSDHRVTGSSPAGCKTSLIADRRTIRQPKQLAHKIVLRHLSATWIPRDGLGKPLLKNPS